MSGTKIIGTIVLISGIAVLVKNYKKDGFLPVLGGTFLLSWGTNILLSKK